MRPVVRAAACGLVLLFAGTCFAQGADRWPARPVRMIVPFAPAGPTDIIARLVGAKAGEFLNTQVVIENHAGAGGNIGAAMVAKSAPDGYTALLTSSAFAVNVSLFSNPGYETRQFEPVVVAARQPNLIFVAASYPARTMAELVDLAKRTRPGYASPGVGTTPHLTAENLFNVTAKLNVTAIHFKGAGQAVVAVLGGEPRVGVGAISGPLAQIKAGKLRGIAVSSATRIAALPDVPTFAEAGFPGVEDYTWIGMLVPAGTPPAIVQRLNEATNQALRTPELRERLEAVAFEPVGGSAQQFIDYLKVEIPKWGKVVRAGNIKAE
jgi:tripartite-type tricarboxylate transporter receptor subunit TctC